MRKGLENPNSIKAVREATMEIASELGIADIDIMTKDKHNQQNVEINKKLVERSRSHLIGFK